MTEHSSYPISKLRLFWSMMRYGLAHNRDFAKEHYQFFNEMLAYLRKQEKDPLNLRVLDIGCGKTFWLTLLLNSYGAKASGFDTEPVTPRLSIGTIWEILRNQGFERAARTAVWGLIFARSYYKELGKIAPFPLQFNDLDLRTTSAEKLPFEDNEFDLAVSHEVFEHLPDVPAALTELRRVIKNDGITYIYIHNYTSVSGGHHIAWKYPDTEPSDEVPPWDHIRENRFPDIPSWINRLRIHEYREYFEDQFEIIDWVPVGLEGESLLTDEIQTELGDYSRDELLTKGFVVVAKPRLP